MTVISEGEEDCWEEEQSRLAHSSITKLELRGERKREREIMMIPQPRVGSQSRQCSVLDRSSEREWTTEEGLLGEPVQQGRVIIRRYTSVVIHQKCVRGMVSGSDSVIQQGRCNHLL